MPGDKEGLAICAPTWLRNGDTNPLAFMGRVREFWQPFSQNPKVTGNYRIGGEEEMFVESVWALHNAEELPSQGGGKWGTMPQT